MFSWLKGKASPVAQPQGNPVQASQEIEAQILARFPPDKLYRVPQTQEIVGLGDKFAEDPGLWENLLRAYPTPPQTEGEREAREAAFWAGEANRCTRLAADGTIMGMRPKQEILDHFIRWEKWVFRHYYGATGILHKTIQEEFAKAAIASRRALDDNASWRKKHSRGGPSDSPYAETIRRAGDALERVVKDTRPAHEKQWSEWYFFHAQEAFKKQHEPKEQEDRHVHGEGGFATRDAIDRAARGQAHGPAREQQFEE